MHGSRSSSAQARDFLSTILKNATRMNRLTEDLLVMARVESSEQELHPGPIPADVLVRDALPGVELGDSFIHLRDETETLDRLLWTLEYLARGPDASGWWAVTSPSPSPVPPGEEGRWVDCRLSGA